MPTPSNAVRPLDPRRTLNPQETARRDEIDARVKAWKPLRKCDKEYPRLAGLTRWERKGRVVL